MSALNAGLPKPAAINTAFPVGDLAPKSGQSALLTMRDGSQWLRTGAVIPRAGYPDAAAVEHLRAHIFTEITGATAIAATGVATDGNGTFVVAYNSTTQVLVSNDYGATWTLRAHNSGGGAISDVVWTGIRFAGVGNDATGVFGATSSDGITWAQSTVATALVGYTVITAKACWTGTGVIVVAQSNTTAGIWTSPTGLSGTWTARTAALAINSAPQIDGFGANALIVLSTASATQQKSLDTGATWVSQSIGSANATGTKPIVLANNVAIVMLTATTYTFTTDFVNWSPTAFSAGVRAVNGGTFFKTPAGRVYGIGSGLNIVLFTDDGFAWREQAVSWLIYTDAATSPASCLFCFDGVRTAVCLGLGVSRKPRVASSSFGFSNGVGTGVTDSSTGLTLYARIK